MANVGASNNSIKKKHLSQSRNHENNETSRVDDKVNDKKHSCSDHILQTLKQINHASTYKDFGTAYRYGTLRNTVNKLASNGKILKLPKECPRRFILPQWAHRPEYSSVQK